MITPEMIAAAEKEISLGILRAVPRRLVAERVLGTLGWPSNLTAEAIEAELNTRYYAVRKPNHEISESEAASISRTIIANVLRS